MAVKKLHVVGGSIIPQSDFNQTDETQADYIKNKPDGVYIGQNGSKAGSEIFNDYTSNEANGMFAHAENVRTKANAMGTHTEGLGTVADGKYQHVQGKFNILDSENKYADIIGNGTGEDARSNASTVDWDGNAWFAGNITLGEENKEVATKDYITDVIRTQADYAELDPDAPSFIQNKPFGEVQIYNGLLTIPEYTGEEISTNKVTLASGVTTGFVKVADLETDHYTTILSISEIEFTNGKKYSGTDPEYGIWKKYYTDVSECDCASGLGNFIAVEREMVYALYGGVDSNDQRIEYIFTFPEPGLYLLKFGWWPAKITFDKVIKKIDEEFMPESCATKDYVNDKLDGIAVSGGQVQSDYTETDNTKASYIKNKPTVDSIVTKNSVNLITSGAVFDAINEINLSGGDIEVPTALSDLTDDAEHRLVTDIEKETWNNKSDFSGSYDDLTNKPEIPSIEGLATKEEVNQLLDSFAAMLDIANREVI